MRLAFVIRSTTAPLAACLVLLACADIGRPFADVSSVSVADVRGTGDVSAGDVSAGDAIAGDDATPAADVVLPSEISDDVPMAGLDTVISPADVPSPADGTGDSEAPIDVEEADTDGFSADDIEDGEDGADAGSTCAPCFVDADCGGGSPCVLISAQLGSACGYDCGEPVCPDGDSTLGTTCSRTSLYGTCPGVRACDEGALSDCSARDPEVEQCNGLDDDCDGATDEGFSDIDADGLPMCTDPDDDGDGVLDGKDNCPTEPNTDQSDRDDDGLGDTCDDDIDGDGVDNSIDCAPLDPNVSGGPETCNGKDDDCDGLIDEVGALGCQGYFPDQDLDGFGLTALGQCLCGPTAKNNTPTPGDCNDQNPFVNPGATEVCNGQDDDCDVIADEEGAEGCTDYHYDYDSDTYYISIALARCLCAPSYFDKYTGLSTGDCDDTNSVIHPGAPEVCNGADESCDQINDEGCDSDGDGYCDAALSYAITGMATCPLGAGDCDDTDWTVHPGIAEACDGKDTNCDPSDDKNEGTLAACGAFCAPCPAAPAGSAYYCSGLGSEAACLLECAGGKFCSDCSCDGSQLLSLGLATPDAKLLYDAALDTFRVAYYAAGEFRLRAIGPNGTSGNDVVAVSGVTKWTRWDVTQSPSTGDFFFIWTGYPDSAVRVGIASQYGTEVEQFVVAADPADGSFRQNTAIAWSQTNQTLLALWDENGSFGIDIRGMLLGPNANPYGSPFEVIGGGGDQSGPRLGLRVGNKGYALAYVTKKASETAAHPEVRFSDASGNTSALFNLSPDAKAGTLSEMWFDGKVDRGVVQWLGADDQYKTLLVGPDGPIGLPVALGFPMSTASGAPKQNAMRLYYVAQGGLRSRVMDKDTGQIGPVELQLAESGTITSVVGSVSHPLGYSIVVWNTADGLRGRLVAP